MTVDSSSKMTTKVSRILSANELVQYRENKTLPVKGSKDFKPTNSWLEKKQIQNALDERKSLLDEERVEKWNALAGAEWNPQNKVAEVTRRVGNHWETMGREKAGKLVLLPEEAMYLLEINALELMFGGVAMSIQQGYNVLLGPETGCSLNEYRTYAHLMRQGYRVIRHQGSLNVTQYERQIRLHQHTLGHKPRKWRGNQNVDTSSVTETTTSSVTEATTSSVTEATTSSVTVATTSSVTEATTSSVTETKPIVTEGAANEPISPITKVDEKKVDEDQKKSENDKDTVEIVDLDDKSELKKLTKSSDNDIQIVFEHKATEIIEILDDVKPVKKEKNEMDKELKRFYDEIEIIDLADEDDNSKAISLKSDTKRKLILDSIVSAHGTKVVTVVIPSFDLLPLNVRPCKSVYHLDLMKLHAVGCGGKNSESYEPANKRLKRMQNRGRAKWRSSGQRSPWQQRNNRWGDRFTQRNNDRNEHNVQWNNFPRKQHYSFGSWQNRMTNFVHHQRQRMSPWEYQNVVQQNPAPPLPFVSNPPFGLWPNGPTNGNFHSQDFWGPVNRPQFFPPENRIPQFQNNFAPVNQYRPGPSQMMSPNPSDNIRLEREGFRPAPLEQNIEIMRNWGKPNLFNQDLGESPWNSSDNRWGNSPNVRLESPNANYGPGEHIRPVFPFSGPSECDSRPLPPDRNYGHGEAIQQNPYQSFSNNRGPASNTPKRPDRNFIPVPRFDEDRDTAYRRWDSVGKVPKREMYSSQGQGGAVKNREDNNELLPNIKTDVPNIKTEVPNTPGKRRNQKKKKQKKKKLPKNRGRYFNSKKMMAVWKAQDEEMKRCNSSIPKVPICARTWDEFKSKLQVLENPLISIWSDEVTPLLKPKDSTYVGNILSKLKIIKPAEFEPFAFYGENQRNLKISFDLYLPHVPFRKSAPTLPNYRITVFWYEDPLPNPGEIALLGKGLEDDVPFLFAVVLPDSISFFNLATIHLPKDDFTED